MVYCCHDIAAALVVVIFSSVFSVDWWTRLHESRRLNTERTRCARPSVTNYGDDSLAEGGRHWRSSATHFSESGAIGVREQPALHVTKYS